MACLFVMAAATLSPSAKYETSTLDVDTWITTSVNTTIYKAEEELTCNDVIAVRTLSLAFATFTVLVTGYLITALVVYGRRLELSLCRCIKRKLSFKYLQY